MYFSRIRSDIDSGLVSLNKKAGLNLLNISFVPPTGVPNTGVPQAMASTFIKPNPSKAMVGRINRSAVW